MRRRCGRRCVSLVVAAARNRRSRSLRSCRARSAAPPAPRRDRSRAGAGLGSGGGRATPGPPRRAAVRRGRRGRPSIQRAAAARRPAGPRGRSRPVPVDGDQPAVDEPVEDLGRPASPGRVRRASTRRRVSAVSSATCTSRRNICADPLLGRAELRVAPPPRYGRPRPRSARRAGSPRGHPRPGRRCQVARSACDSSGSSAGRGRAASAECRSCEEELDETVLSVTPAFAPARRSPRAARSSSSGRRPPGGLQRRCQAGGAAPCVEVGAQPDHHRAGVDARRARSGTPRAPRRRAAGVEHLLELVDDDMRSASTPRTAASGEAVSAARSSAASARGGGEVRRECGERVLAGGEQHGPGRHRWDHPGAQNGRFARPEALTTTSGPRPRRSVSAATIALASSARPKNHGASCGGSFETAVGRLQPSGTDAAREPF